MLRSMLSLVLLISIAASTVCGDERPKKLLLIGQGPDGHPAATHEFMAGLKVLARCLEPFEAIELQTVRADEPWEEGPELLRKADAAVMFLSQGSRWMQADPRRYQALQRLAARGGGLVALHWAVGAHDAKYIDGQLRLLGGSRGGPQRRYAILETDVRVLEHPITRGIAPFRVRDEFYYRLDLVQREKGLQPILETTIEQENETVCWAWQRPDGGRSFGFVGLHFHENWGREDYRRLATQGVLWTLKLPIPEEGVPVPVSEEDLQLPPVKKGGK